ncbi:MAG: ribonuclease III [Alphaproteobacteria bacterium]
MTEPDATLERAIGHTFADRSLLRRALTHPSLDRNEGNYDRLEFLGDRVLGLAIAERLYERDPTAAAGDLAVRYNALVRKEMVAEVARGFDLGAHVEVSPGERAQGGADKDAILADACEALIGAVFLDAGYAAAAAVIDRHWVAHLKTSARAGKDFKSRLQEWLQGRGRPLPTYEIVSREGPDHAPHFTVAVSIDNDEPATGEGTALRAAEQAAAQAMLHRLDPENE